MNSKLAILVVILVAGLIGAGIAYTLYVTLPNNGTILTPPTIEATPDTINWGEFYITELPKSQTVRLTNIGDSPTDLLHMRIVWETPTTEVASIIWDQENTVIPSGAYIDALFTIEATPTPTYQGPFTFNIIIESAP